MKILLAVDDHGRCFEAASRAARWFTDSEVVALHVRTVAGTADLEHALAATPAYGFASSAEVLSGYPYREAGAGAESDDLVEHARHVADEAASMAGAEARVDAGDPAATILAVADEIDADLIIVGTGDRSWLARLFMPSVSDRVIHDAPCSVLVIRCPEPPEPGSE